MKRNPLLFLTLLSAACNPEPSTNLALYRTAYSSSCYDHNLTAQLLTDGIIEPDGPSYMELVTSEGTVDRVEREASIDGDVMSRNPITGDKGWMEYRFHGYEVRADRAEVLCQQALPGGRGGTPMTLDVPVTMMDDGALRLELEFPHEARWRIKNVDFYNGETPLTDILPGRHFTSAWMSDGMEDEWVMVDLGAVCRLDSVHVAWLQEVPRDIVWEMSRDGVRWKPFRRGRGRYVRLSMHADSTQTGRFCISELEVYGPGVGREDKGGWKLMRASEVAACGEEISAQGYICKDWLPAVVPGTVLSSFIKAGAVPDPEYGDDVRFISDSYFCSDFWYRREFDISEYLPDGLRDGAKYFLDFDGINWKAEIYFNGQRLGDMEGAFIRGRMDITALLRDGTNVLAVKILQNANPGCVKEKTAVWTGYNGGILGYDSPTFLASIGWDWLTTVRGRNCGIWNDVRMVQTGPLQLSDPLVMTHLSDDGLASMTVSVRLAGDVPDGEEAVVEGYVGDIFFSKAVSECGAIVFTPQEYPQLADRSMELWWPEGYGEPHLYDAGFRVVSGSELSDSISYKAGIREVTCTGLSDTLRLYVNGRRINAMGGNWGFSQHNLDFSAEQYEAAVDYHSQMHFNMIRNWVGQVADDEFYEACDRHGIMVWQDFWLANPGDGPDPADESMFLANAGDMVSRIRRHPCVAIYCGRNEGNPPETLDRALRSEIVGALHPDIPYISNSADGIVSGHGPYEAKPAEYYFAHQSGMFHSERGVPVISTYESLCRMMPEEDRWPIGEMWGKHDFTRDGAQRNVTYKAMMEDAFGECGSAEEYTALAQWVNYECNRAIFESANAGGRMGILLWMSHSAWPSLVYCTYDYYFEPTGAFFGCKKACEPLHIQFNPLASSVDIVNNCALRTDCLSAQMTLYGCNGNVCRSDSVSGLTCEEDSVLHCFDVTLPEDEEVCYLALKLYDASGVLISDNFYILGRVPGDLKALRKLPAARISKEVSVTGECAAVKLKNCSDVPALLVRLILTDSRGEEVLPVNYSDNYFALMPGEEKDIEIKWNSSDAGKVNVSLSQMGDFNR